MKPPHLKVLGSTNVPPVRAIAYLRGAVTDYYGAIMTSMRKSKNLGI
jgi:hypothetical protein